MKLCVKKAMAVFISIVIISMCCSIKSYAISMNLELSGDNITYSNGVYMCSKMIPVGGKMNIKAEYVTSNEMSPAPTGETSREDVSSQCTWKSSDEKIAKVSNGVIEGMAEITATYKERSATVSLAVGEDRVITIGDNISIVQKDNIKTVEKGKNLQLDIEGVESLTNAVKNEDVTWSSSDEKIATVDKSGLVTAIASGNVTIKAEYMSYHIGEEFEGIISGVTGWGFYVELPNTIEGMVHVSILPGDYYYYDEKTYSMVGERTGRTFKLGEKAKIRVKDVDMMLKNIDFELVEDDDYEQSEDGWN